jgi:hypothetical protein
MNSLILSKKCFFSFSFPLKQQQKNILSEKAFVQIYCAHPVYIVQIYYAHPVYIFS